MENILSLHIKKSKAGISILLAQEQQINIIKDIFIENISDIIKNLTITYSIKTILVPFNLNLLDMNEIEELGVKLTFSTPLNKNLKIFGRLQEKYSYFGFSISILSVSSLLNHIKDLDEYDCINFLNQKINETCGINKKNCKINLTTNYISAGLIDTFNIILLDLDDRIFLNIDTIYSLSIFNQNIHPHTNLSSTSRNDLFNYLNYTCTNIGKEKLKQWLLMPLRKLCDIYSRTNAIDFIIINKLTNIIYNTLKNIKNHSFTDNIYCIDKRKYFISYKKLLETFFELFGILGNKQKINNNKILLLIPHITNSELNILIKFYESINKKISEKDQFIIQKGVCKELDEIKNKYDNIDDTITEIANELNIKYNNDFNVVYIPQLGYLIESKYIIAEFSNVNDNNN